MLVKSGPWKSIKEDSTSCPTHTSSVAVPHTTSQESTTGQYVEQTNSPDPKVFPTGKHYIIYTYSIPFF